MRHQFTSQDTEEKRTDDKRPATDIFTKAHVRPDYVLVDGEQLGVGGHLALGARSLFQTSVCVCVFFWGREGARGRLGRSVKHVGSWTKQIAGDSLAATRRIHHNDPPRAGAGPNEFIFHCAPPLHSQIGWMCGCWLTCLAHSFDIFFACTASDMLVQSVSTYTTCSNNDIPSKFF